MGILPALLSAYDHQHISLVHGLPFIHAHLFDRASNRRAQVILHFHGLEDNYRLASFYGGTHFQGNAKYEAGHRSAYHCLTGFIRPFYRTGEGFLAFVLDMYLKTLPCYLHFIGGAIFLVGLDDAASEDFV